MRGPTGGAVLLLLFGVPVLAGCVAPGEPGEVDENLQDALVVAQHHIAAQAGAEILRRGGDAIDAAAAVQWALNVVEPQFSGIGGGAFLVRYDAATGTVTTLDGRETAPASATPGMFQPDLVGPDYDPTLMGYAVGVPGTLRLFEDAVARWGRMSLAETMEPAIKIADGGWRVTEKFSADIETYRHRIESWPAAAELYLPGSVCVPTQAGYSFTATTVARCQGGAAPAPDTTLRNPALAETFRLLQREGTGAFYGGEIADAIIATVAEREGSMTKGDLASYAVVERAPLVKPWRGYDIVTMDMPSSALTMLQMLGMLEEDRLATNNFAQAPDSLHLMIEAMHLAYADRAAYLGDEAFVDVPKAALLDSDYLAERRALIRMDKANPTPTAGDPQNGQAVGPMVAVRDEGHHTSHFVIVDHDGDVVSVTTTIEHYFGTGMLVPGYGFFLNNELTDFDWTPGGPNEAAPGKRPRSSMSPTIVLQDGEPVLALGSPGGSTIITSVYQVLVNVLDQGLSIDLAVVQPRIYSPAYPNVRWESGIVEAYRDLLRARGHLFDETPSVIGSVQAAQRTADGWVGAADHRRDGGVVVVPPTPSG